MANVIIEYYNAPGGISVQCDDAELLSNLIYLAEERHLDLETLLHIAGLEYRIITKEEQFTHTEVKGLKLSHVTSKWEGRYEVNEIYKCPSCNKGQITYYKDRTPGFKESYWKKCSKCGFNPKE